MIDKVLIAEDHEFTNLSVQKAMDDLKIKQYDHTFYCDDALNKIKVALQQGEPYDLLITDLSFEDDETIQHISNGFDLIAAVRAIQPAIQVLVLSAESLPATIDKLYTTHRIDGYVRKARHDAKELKLAMEALSKGQCYFPLAITKSIRQSNTYEFTQFDISVIRLLSEGRPQNEIPVLLQQKNIHPSSLSTVEKRLKQIRAQLGFSKNEQLVLFCRDAGVL